MGCYRFFCAPLCAVCCWLLAGVAGGHEVDQYDIPEGTDLVDHGDYWDQLLYRAVERGVAKTNQAIDDTRRLLIVPGVRQARLAQLQSPSHLTWAVRHQLPNAVMAIAGTEWKLHQAPQAKEGQSQDNKAVNLYYSSPLSGTYSKLPWWPDPRILTRISLLRSSAVKVHGQYIGVDKLAHFTGMGAWYYAYYQAARAAGKSQSEAIAVARSIGKYGPLSETWLVGGIPTGIYSNADMAANYVGLKYYINLTEPVTIRGELRGPMVVWDGDRWQIQPFVKPEYFAQFMSPHFDEVLNPCLYEWTFRDRVRVAVHERRRGILSRYAGGDLERRSPEYFDAVLADCLTYYGEDYGHSGQVDKLITVAKVCFDPPGVDGVPNKEVQIAAADKRHRQRWMPPQSGAIQATALLPVTDKDVSLISRSGAAGLRR